MTKAESTAIQACVRLHSVWARMLHRVLYVMGVVAGGPIENPHKRRLSGVKGSAGNLKLHFPSCQMAVAEISRHR